MGENQESDSQKDSKQRQLTKYLQMNTLTAIARTTLPTSRKIRKASSSSGPEAPSWAGFSLASWSRSLIASSKRDRYCCRPRRGERGSPSPARSPRTRCRGSPGLSSSPLPPSMSLISGVGREHLLSKPSLWRLPPSSLENDAGRVEEMAEDQASVLSRSMCILCSITWPLTSARKTGQSVTYLLLFWRYHYQYSEYLI